MGDSDCSDSHTENQNHKKVKKVKKEDMRKEPEQESVTSDEESDNELFDEEEYEYGESYDGEGDANDNDSSCSIDAFEFFSRYLENDQEESIIDVLTSMRDNGNDTRNAILKVAKELHNLNANMNTLISGMMVEEEEYEEQKPRRSKKTRS